MSSNMVRDNEIKATVSPFAIRPGEIKVFDGKDGYVTKTFDDEEFYHKIKFALKEKGKLNKSLIQKEYEGNFSMKVCARKYFELYENYSLVNR